MKKEYTKPEIRFERLRDIDGFSDYQISDNGIVVSCKFGKMRILKPFENGHGYLQVELWTNGEQQRFLVHHLVAEAFIPNPENKPCIDHIDGNPLNNFYLNLRWCTHKENCNNPITKKRYSEAHRKTVICYKNNIIVKIYLSTRDAEKDGFNHCDVAAVCRGKRKFHKGHRFRYATEEDVN